MKPITIYWAPSAFNIDHESWNIPYRDPVPIANYFKENLNNSDFLVCPAFRDSIKNIYSFNSVFDEYTQLDPAELQLLYENEDLRIPLNTDLRLQLIRHRKNSLKNHINVIYNMSWVLFADEPLIAKFSAPYAPATTPAAGATLASGQFDIGQWFRSYNLEYFLPITATSFQYHENDPLFYLELQTERKIIFKRFTRNSKLEALEQEAIQSTHRYGLGYTLAQRYNMFKQSRMRNMILKEIQQNLV